MKEFEESWCNGYERHENYPLLYNYDWVERTVWPLRTTMKNLQCNFEKCLSNAHARSEFLGGFSSKDVQAIYVFVHAFPNVKRYRTFLSIGIRGRQHENIAATCFQIWQCWLKRNDCINVFPCLFMITEATWDSIELDRLAEQNKIEIYNSYTFMSLFYHTHINRNRPLNVTAQSSTARSSIQTT